MDQLLLTVTQAAALTGFGRSTIYAMAAAGELPVVRHGASVRINAAALCTWIAENTEGGRPAASIDGGINPGGATEE
jgi:excisionase family DNA binding protein